MSSFSPQISSGSQVQQTQIFDVGEVARMNVNSPEFKQFLVTLTQAYNNMAIVLNASTTGYLSLSEIQNGQLLFPDQTIASDVALSNANTPVYRNVFRKCFLFGALNAGASTTSIDHEIGTEAVPGVPPRVIATADYTFTRIWGCMSDTTGFTYYPLPYSSPVLADNIELWVDTQKIYIKTGKDQTNFDKIYVFLEYIKQ